MGRLQAELTDDEQILILHVRQTFSCVRQLKRYTIVPRAPPLCLCTMVKEAKPTVAEMQRAKAFLEFNFKLHTSQEPFQASNFGGRGPAALAIYQEGFAAFPVVPPKDWSGRGPAGRGRGLCSPPATTTKQPKQR